MSFSSIPIMPAELQSKLQRIEEQARALVRVSTN